MEKETDSGTGLSKTLDVLSSHYIPERAKRRSCLRITIRRGGTNEPEGEGG